MEIKKIQFIETETIQIQINNVKKILIETNVILGKKFTFEMATLVLQTEKLINYYDSKKLGARFNANFRAVELTLSNEDISLKDVSSFITELSSIKTDFNNATTNEQKKSIMFKLLFFHMNVLFNAYQQSKELKTNTSVRKSTSESTENLEKLTIKQKEKYLVLMDKLETADLKEKYKIRVDLLIIKD